MKQIPDILSFEQWLSNLDDQEKADMLDITLEEFLQDEPTPEDVECPSCEGDGYIEFEHIFKELDGSRGYTEYRVDCEVCEGVGTIENDIITWDDKLKSKYKDKVVEDKLLYKTYLECNQH